MSKYYIVQYTDETYGKIKNVQKYFSNKSYVELVNYMEEKISKNIYWNIIMPEDGRYDLVDYLYQFKHNTTLRDILDELEDISQLIDNNLNWIEEYCKDEKNE